MNIMNINTDISTPNATSFSANSSSAKISVYIIAYNEAEKIAEAIKTVLWADEIIVADSYSADGTAQIAVALGAKVVQIPFNGFGDLRNQALQACSYEWIFSLDADERCTPEAQQEILRIINSSAALNAYFVPRKNIFLGRWIKHTWSYPDYRQPQLFRKGRLEYTYEQVHEGFKLLGENANFVASDDGKKKEEIGLLNNAIWQIPYRNLEEIMYKANRYSSLGAEKLYAKKVRVGAGKALGHALWNFFRHYIMKAGFLDGWPGFIIAFANFEGTFYRYAKLMELYRAEVEIEKK